MKIETRSVYHFLNHCQTLYNIGPEDRVSNFSEVSFDFSVLDLWLTWYARASLHVVPESQLMAPARFIQEHKLTFWASVPSVILFLDRLKHLKEGCFPTLRVSYFCGEALPLSSALLWGRAAPNCVIDNHYGPTEATVGCSLERLTDPPNLTPGRDILSIGRPYSGMRMAIVGEQGIFLPQGETGELALSGPQITQGYLGDDELTSRRLPVLDHPSLGRLRWYLTGDLSFEDASGTFHHMGRIDNQVKVLGHRIELEELDAHLRQVCKCESVVMVAWPIRNGSAEGVVAFVCATGITTGQILDGLKKRLPPYALPREIIEIESMPMTPNGKIDRKALLNILAGRMQGSGI
ncbi:MAG: AMP-binding protein [Candidatus Riflebacteria bacterium]|nr:AMP-binding protein [Candidatus Riflebacteria bacterium]